MILSVCSKSPEDSFAKHFAELCHAVLVHLLGLFCFSLSLKGLSSKCPSFFMFKPTVQEIVRNLEKETENQNLLSLSTQQARFV